MCVCPLHIPTVPTYTCTAELHIITAIIYINWPSTRNYPRIQRYERDTIPCFRYLLHRAFCDRRYVPKPNQYIRQARCFLKVPFEFEIEVEVELDT